MKLIHNIKIYYLYSIFSELLIVGPIIVLFMIAKGLSFTQIMVLQSICALALVAFDVPTGVIADKIGRKFSLLLGAFFWAVGCILYIYGNAFIIFAFAETIFSLGTAFKSGANAALIYDSLKAIGKEAEFAKIQGKASSYIFYAQAIGVVIAGFVYTININLPLFISAGFMIMAIIISLFFTDPPIEDKQDIDNIKYSKQMLDSFRYIIGHEKIKAIIFFTMVYFVFYRASFWFYQPYMQAVNIPVQYFGIIFFAFNIVAGLASKNCQYIIDKTKPKTLTFISLIFIASFVLLGLVKVWIGIAAIFLQQIARGVYGPVIAKYLNKHAPSNKRATILSFQSFASNIAVVVSFPLLGMIKDQTDIFSSQLIMAGAMGILTVVAVVYMNKRLGVKKEESELTNHLG